MTAQKQSSSSRGERHLRVTEVIIVVAAIITTVLMILAFVFDHPRCAGILAIITSVVIVVLLALYGRMPTWIRLSLIPFVVLFLAVGIWLIRTTRTETPPPPEPGKTTKVVPLPGEPNVPSPPVGQLLIKWDFEGGKTQGWGTYEERGGRIVESPDVTCTRGDFADGGLCLRVDNINTKAESQSGTDAFKKRVGVRCAGNLPFGNAKLAASVYVPATAGFDYADAKFFLFAGDKWEWHESGTEGQGTLLEPGKPVEIAWDLRYDETRKWLSPWPWRDIIGIQIYIEGTFKGPVYIDNVTVTAPK